MLCTAGLLEIAFAYFMKTSDGFTRPTSAALTIASGLTSVVFLSIAIRSIPIGTGYAVWTGIGAAGTAIIGIVLLGDSSSVPRLLCIALILLGVIGLKFFPTI